MPQTNTMSFQVFIRKNALPKEMEKNYFEMKLHNFKTKKRSIEKSGKRKRKCHAQLYNLFDESTFTPFTSFANDCQFPCPLSEGVVECQRDVLVRETIQLLSELEHELDRSFNTQVVSSQFMEIPSELSNSEPSNMQHECALVLSEEAIRELQQVSFRQQ